MRVAVIPARAGSKRLPGKNCRLFHGKPIIWYPIQTALRSKLFTRIIVSTDSREISDIALECGATNTIMRSEKLSDDHTGTPEVMQAALNAYWDDEFDVEKIDYACCIYATAPLMTVEDLHVGIHVLKDASLCKFSFSMGTEPPKDAGAWYSGTRQAWIEGAPLVAPHSIMVPIPPERVCDINTAEDFRQAEHKYAAMCGVTA